MEILQDVFSEILEDKIENIFGKAKSDPETPINLHSSISKKKRNNKKITTELNLLKKNTLKRKKLKSPNAKLKFITRNPALLLDSTQYRYTTIKITDNLYYSIDKCGYIFLCSDNFIPNTYILCKSYVNPINKLQLLLDNKLVLSDIKFPINERTKIYMGDKVYNSLMKSNKQFSKLFNKKIAIPFCDFRYDYHIKYITNKHEIAIQILDKNNVDVSNKFESQKMNIHSWVIHEVEKFDKDFLIYRLRYHLKIKTEEVNKLRRHKLPNSIDCK